MGQMRKAAPWNLLSYSSIIKRKIWMRRGVAVGEGEWEDPLSLE